MLPVIFLVGSTSSGKGTLGARLAADFNLRHISLGEEIRTMSLMKFKAIPEMACEINEYLVGKREIPAAALRRHYPRGCIPAILLRHNHRFRQDESSYVLAAILRDKIDEIIEKGGSLPRAVIVDGLNGTFSGEGHKSFRRQVRDFTPSYSGLTIHINSPHTVAKTRYLARGRPGDGDVRVFEERTRHDNDNIAILLHRIKRVGVVVTTVNDGSMSIDLAYQTLLRNLRGVPEWMALVKKRTK
ncbi:hypothetical protein GGR51DRAFT_562531 [Nemania sp. FL0031]|nr:hypothetical protein GGR51DRAFT_562531 [Nemania sp. FL0031]